MSEKELHDWIIEYIKHRDLIKKEILNLEEKNNLITVKYKTKTHLYIIITDLKEQEIAKHLKQCNGAVNLSLIFPNTVKIVEAVIKVWDKLIEYQHLSLFFVNPRSVNDKKWIIFPQTHHRISYPASLKIGLMALYEGVGEY